MKMTAIPRVHVSVTARRNLHLKTSVAPVTSKAQQEKPGRLLMAGEPTS